MKHQYKNYNLHNKDKTLPNLCIHTIQQELNNKGWTSIRNTNLWDIDSLLIVISQQLGTPVQGRNGCLVEKLSPLNHDKAYLFSLSRKFGYTPLPLHTDTAHWIIPCRYIILACKNPGNVSTPTTLLDTSKLFTSQEDSYTKKSALFFVRNGRKSFYAHSYSKDLDFFRFDPGCMEPINQEAIKLNLILSQENLEAYTLDFEWEYGNILIIDNWRMLHGRNNAAEADPQRLILRIMVQ